MRMCEAHLAGRETGALHGLEEIRRRRRTGGRPRAAAGTLLDPRWGPPADTGKAGAALVRGDLPSATGAVITQDGGLGLPRL